MVVGRRCYSGRLTRSICLTPVSRRARCVKVGAQSPRCRFGTAGISPTSAAGGGADHRGMDYATCRDRYASAVHTSDLTPRARSVLAPLDLLGAAGMAGQRQPLGMLLQRLRAEPSAAAQRVAAAALAERLREAVRRRQVRRDGAASECVAADALAWWLDPTCRCCGGVQFVARDARLTAKVCRPCAGTGRRPLESSAPDAAAWVVDAIDQHVWRSEAAHRRALW